MKKGDTVYLLDRAAGKPDDRKPKPVTVVSIGPRYVTVKHFVMSVKFELSDLQDGMISNSHYELYGSLDAYNEHQQMLAGMRQIRERITYGAPLRAWQVSEILRIMNTNPPKTRHEQLLGGEPPKQR